MRFFVIFIGLMIPGLLLRSTFRFGVAVLPKMRTRFLYFLLLYVFVFAIKLDILALNVSFWAHLTQHRISLFKIYLCINFIAVSALMLVTTLLNGYFENIFIATIIYASWFKSFGARPENLSFSSSFGSMFFFEFQMVLFSHYSLKVLTLLASLFAVSSHCYDPSTDMREADVLRSIQHYFCVIERCVIERYPALCCLVRLVWLTSRQWPSIRLHMIL